MSSSEELSQYESKPNKTFKSLNNKAQDGNRPAIPRDVYGWYGVHVSNFPHGITENELEKTFAVTGRVRVCKLMGKESSTAYAFVKYASLKEAQDALLKFDGYKLNGSVLAVRPAYVSRKSKRDPTPGIKRDDYDTSPEEGRVNNNEKLREEDQQTTYVMQSSDCHLRDGKLNDGDVMVFNGTSGKVTPPRKVNNGRFLAPRFQKDSPPKSSVSNASQDSREFQNTGSSQTSGMSSSAFRPYRGKLQESHLQNGGPLEHGIATVASSLAQLGLPSSDCKNIPTWNYRQGNATSTRQQGGAQVITSWSETGNTGIASWCPSKDRSLTSPGRNAPLPEQCPQTRSGVSSWSTADVVQFFHSTDCAEYAGFFQEQEIDGKALMLLNRDTLLHFMKVGPALKVLQLINELRSCSSPTSPSSNGW